MTVEFILSIVNLVDIGAFPKKPLKLSEDEGQTHLRLLLEHLNVWPVKKKKKREKEKDEFIISK